jgi:hypothetical protein
VNKRRVWHPLNKGKRLKHRKRNAKYWSRAFRELRKRLVLAAGSFTTKYPVAQLLSPRGRAPLGIHLAEDRVSQGRIRVPRSMRKKSP